MKTILVPLADGFEEIEAILPVDIWRRAGLNVTTAGLSPHPIQASRQTVHIADCTLESQLHKQFDLIYLPGGRPGADHLAAHLPLLEMLKTHASQGKRIAAICAAPLALQAAGLLDTAHFTAHPSAHAELKRTPSTQRVVTDGQLTTAIAAGASIELAFEILHLLEGPQKVHQVNQGLLAPASLLPAS